MSLKAMNGFSGPHGLPPTMLVYGTMPRARAAGLDFALPKSDVLFKAMAAARAEYLKLVNASRINGLYNKTVSPTSDLFLNPGDLAYVWREKEEQYTGPFTVMSTSTDNSHVQLSLDDREGDKKRLVLYGSSAQSSSRIRHILGISSLLIEAISF